MGASLIELKKVYRRILGRCSSFECCTAAESFSTIRRIKTYNRSNGNVYMAVLSTEREKSEDLITNPDEVLIEFARDKHRWKFTMIFEEAAFF